MALSYVGLMEGLYMKQPIGFEDGIGQVCRLFKSIYGLEQAGNVWNHNLNSTMPDFRYTHPRSIYCAYILRDEEKNSIIVVWVDDMVSITNTKQTNNKVVEKLAAKYKIKVICTPIILRMHIMGNYENHTIRLSQTHYIHQILKEFNMWNVNTVLMTMGLNVIQHRSNSRLAINKQNGTTYIGKLLDAAHATR
jgi:hypothetical protein